MTFIDESDFVDYGFFTKTVAPLLLVQGMCLMMVTTLNNNPNVLYQKMFEDRVMKDGGVAFTQWTFQFKCCLLYTSPSPRD